MRSRILALLLALATAAGLGATGCVVDDDDSPTIVETEDDDVDEDVDVEDDDTDVDVDVDDEETPEDEETT